jgi:SAM-dependent methyltransferase
MYVSAVTESSKQQIYGEKDTIVLDGIEYPRDSTWINSLENETHWRLYWRQQSLMDGLLQAGDRVLEIGPGTGFTTNYLRSKGVHVTTLDFAPGMKPDIVANMLTYDFPDRYDAILAFEVFEHVPFAKFQEIFPRIASACGKFLFFSVPRNKKTPLSVELKLPSMKPFKFGWSMKRGRMSSPNHFWEIDYNDVALSDLRELVTKNGMKLEREFEAFFRMFFACRLA